MKELRPPPASPFETFDDEEPTTSVSLPPTQQTVETAFDAAMRARATLTLVSGPTAGAIYTLLMEETVIGREKEMRDPNRRSGAQPQARERSAPVALDVPSTLPEIRAAHRE